MTKAPHYLRVVGALVLAACSAGGDEPAPQPSKSAESGGATSPSGSSAGNESSASGPSASDAAVADAAPAPLDAELPKLSGPMAPPEDNA